MSVRKVPSKFRILLLGNLNIRQCIRLSMISLKITFEANPKWGPADTKSAFSFSLISRKWSKIALFDSSIFEICLNFPEGFFKYSSEKVSILTKSP